MVETFCSLYVCTAVLQCSTTFIDVTLVSASPFPFLHFLCSWFSHYPFLVDITTLLFSEFDIERDIWGGGGGGDFPLDLGMTTGMRKHTGLV